MQKITNFFTQNNYTAPAIIIGLSFIIVGLTFKSGASNFANKSDSITVTGSAERVVKSDTAKWTISIISRSSGENALRDATDKTDRSIASVTRFLTRAGIDTKNIDITPITNNQICIANSQGYETCSLGIAGYNTFANITVENDDVKKIDSLSKNISADNSVTGVTGNVVEYYYNNLKNIRVDMLSEATKNAKERAVSVANAGGASIGSITSLSSGVFQVTTKNSVNYDDSGAYDTSTIEKKITATVKANFSLR